MYRIVEKKQLNSTVYSFWINAPQMAREAKAGQFLHILPSTKLLRRPISICEIEGDNIRFIMDVVGDGTREIAQSEEALDVFGPLGNGWTLRQDKRCLIIGGGIGVFPLLQLSKVLPDSKVILGFRNEGQVLLKDEFANAEVVVGGYATDKAREIIADYDCIYACGPKPMLKAVADLAAEFGKWCEVSMEERMACGIGACVGCVVKVNGEYKRVCKEGPVFSASDIDFEWTRVAFAEQAGGCNGK